MRISFKSPNNQYMPNQQLANERHKPIIRKFKKKKSVFFF